MNANDKRERLYCYCDDHDLCGTCPLDMLPMMEHCQFDELPDELIDLAYATAFPEECDLVNHPTHYCREGAMECFDEMLLIFGKDTVAKFCLCNAWKYRYRAADKNGAEDLAKSDWYMAKYRELTDSVEDVFKCSR